MVVLTRLLGGDLPDRVGPARVAIGGGAASRRSGWLAIAVAHSLPVALVGALAMGAAFSLLYPSLSLIVVDRVSGQPAAARRSGTFTAFFDAGVGLGAPLAGARRRADRATRAPSVLAAPRRSARRRSRCSIRAAASELTARRAEAG